MSGGLRGEPAQELERDLGLPTSLFCRGGGGGHDGLCGLGERPDIQDDEVPAIQGMMIRSAPRRKCADPPSDSQRPALGQAESQ